MAKEQIEQGWAELRKILLDPNLDPLLQVRVEVGGQTFEIDALRIQEHVRTTPTSRMIGKSLCGKCMQQKRETTAFACSANGSCAIAVCDDCLLSLVPMCSECDHPKSWHNDPSAYKLDCQGAAVRMNLQDDGTYKKFVLGCSCSLKYPEE